MLCFNIINIFRSLHANGVGSNNVLWSRQGTVAGWQSHRGSQLLAARQHVGAVRDERAASAARELPGTAAAARALTTALHTWQAA